MKTREKIFIPAPLAEVGDKVLVSNYRLKKNKLDTGRITGIRYWAAGKNQPLRWSYDVFIIRAGYLIHVGDDGILENTSKRWV